MIKNNVQRLPEFMLRYLYERFTNDYKKVNRSIKELEREIESYLDKGAIKTAKKKELGLKKLFKQRQKIEKYFINDARGMFMGFGVDLENPSELRPFYFDWGNLINHSEISGSTRYGKSYLLSLMSDQFIRRNDNVFIIDPKGGENQEIIAWTIESVLRHKRGKEFYFFNPLFPQSSLKVNYLYGLGDEEIASLFASISQGGSGGKDSHFYETFSYKYVYAIVKSITYLSSALNRKEDIKAEIEYEYFRFKEMEKYLGFDVVKKDNVNNILIPDLSERIVNNESTRKKYKKKNEDFGLSYNRELITFRDIAKLIPFDRVIELKNEVQMYMPMASLSDAEKNKLEVLRSEALSLIDELSKKDKTYIEKISTSLSTCLDQLSYGRVGEVLCDIRINPIPEKLTNDKNGIVCVIQTVPLKFPHASAAILKIIFKSFEAVFGTVTASGRIPKRRTQLFIDEGKAAVFPGIEEVYNKAAGAGMTIHAFYQSPLDKVVNLGRDLAGVVAENINTEIRMKPNNLESEKAIAQSFGVVTKVKPILQVQAGQTRMGSMTEQESVASTTNLSKLPKGTAFIRHYGKRYRVAFPIISPPEIKIVMPKLDEEKVYEELAMLDIKFDLLSKTVNEDVEVEVKN